MKSPLNNNPITPFIRWAGGKQKLINRLLKFVPADFYERTYKEPFLGAGALFFHLQPQNAFLSDANSHLMNCYFYIKKNPQLIHTYLQQHLSKTNKEYYYKIRDLYNKSIPTAAQAARFIYLNKTCFNGIFRVNLKNQFNVPYGYKEPPVIPSQSQLNAVHLALQTSDLCSKSFEKTTNDLSSNDFIYLDPPYPPINGTSYFTHYTKERFGEKDQETLSTYVNALNKTGAKFMMSNADIPLIRELYKKYNIYDLSVTRCITCKTKKHKVSELVITNYDNFILLGEG